MDLALINKAKRRVTVHNTNIDEAELIKPYYDHKNKKLSKEEEENLASLIKKREENIKSLNEELEIVQIVFNPIGKLIHLTFMLDKMKVILDMEDETYTDGESFSLIEKEMLANPHND